VKQEASQLVEAIYNDSNGYPGCIGWNPRPRGDWWKNLEGLLINEIINYARERHKLRLLRTRVRLPAAPPFNYHLKGYKMKISKRQLKRIISEAISNQMVEPNRVVKSLPSTYQPIHFKSMMGQGGWARKYPETYFSPEQQEKYGDKIAKMRQTDPHQADALAGAIVNEPTGWYDSSKSFSEEEETLIRMHSKEYVPDSENPTNLLNRMRQSVPPTVEKLVANSNPDYKIVYKAAYKIYSTSGVANPWDRDTGTNAISRLYDLINELALKDILTAKAKIEEYLTDAKYAADREEIVSNYRHTDKNGKKLLADIETLVSSFEKQYKTAMNWYYTGQIADGWYMPMLESKQSYTSNKTKISKRQLKRIIREEYSKLKSQGLIRE